MKFTFEKYEFGSRGKIFLGYITVIAEDAGAAHELAQSKVDEGIQVFPIYTPQSY